MLLKIKNIAFAIFILLALGACSNKKGISDLNGGELINTSWILFSMSGELLAEIAISLQFKGDKANGKGVCNNYFSSYSTAGNTISFATVGATKMMCPNHADVEIKYFDWLGKAQKYGIQNNHLTIQTKNGNLIFTKSPPIGMNESTNDHQSIVGTYVTEGFPDKYFQRLNISPSTDGYRVVFSASKIIGESGCSFEGVGQMNHENLIVPITFKDKKVNVVIAKKGKALEVFTQDFNNRFALMQYCNGGSSLAGNYMPQVTSTNLNGLVLDEKKFSNLELTEETLLGEKKLKQIFPEMKISKKTAQTEVSNYDYFLVENAKEKFRINLRKTKKKDFQQINSIVIDSPSIPDVYGIQTGMAFKDIKSKRPNLIITTDSHFHTIAQAKGSNIQYEICCNTSQPDKTSWSEKEVENWKVKSIIWKTS